MSSKKSKWRCSHDGAPIFTLDGRTVGGASDRAAYVAYTSDLIVDCAGSSFSYGKVGYKGKAECLNRFIVDLEMANRLTIDWEDGYDPPVISAFWKEMWAKLTKKNDHIIFTCMGGHGRTGTALCSILIMVGNYHPNVCIPYIRENYCDSAVETKEQVEYLYGLVGEERPANMLGTYEMKSSKKKDDKDDDDEYPLIWFSSEKEVKKK